MDQANLIVLFNMLSPAKSLLSNQGNNETVSGGGGDTNPKPQPGDTGAYTIFDRKDHSKRP